VHLSLGIKEARLRRIRFDGLAVGKDASPSSPVRLPAGSVETFKLTGMMPVAKAVLETGIIHSAIPFQRKGTDYIFEAPLESYRLYTHHAEYRDSRNRVYMITDPYDEMELMLREGKREGEHRVWSGDVEVPVSCRGRDIRLILRKSQFGRVILSSR